MKWIKCSERLPLPNTQVLLTGVPECEDDPKVQAGYFWFPDGKTPQSATYDDCDFDEVTHWMPLPEPPKDDE